MNIGDKLLEMPQTINDADKILIDFRLGFNYYGNWNVQEVGNQHLLDAKRLVELNNEVYEKLHNKNSKDAKYEKCKLCFYYDRNAAITPCQDCFYYPWHARGTKNLFTEK